MNSSSFLFLKPGLTIPSYGVATAKLPSSTEHRKKGFEVTSPKCPRPRDWTQQRHRLPWLFSGLTRVSHFHALRDCALSGDRVLSAKSPTASRCKGLVCYPLSPGIGLEGNRVTNDGVAAHAARIAERPLSFLRTNYMAHVGSLICQSPTHPIQNSSFGAAVCTSSRSCRQPVLCCQY